MIQASQIRIIDVASEITISAIYCPPKHSISAEYFKEYLETLGNRFISGGDWNAKHVHWGSRLINPKGRQLYSAVGALNLECISTGEPTYWPADRARKPDLLDFFITKNLSVNNMSAEQKIDLSSDHTPVVLNVNCKVLLHEAPPKIHSRHTNWEEYQRIITSMIDLKISLKTIEEVEEAIETFNRTVHIAAHKSAPKRKVFVPKEHVYPSFVKDKIFERRHLRKVWHQTRVPRDKAAFNRSTKELKSLISDLNNDKLQEYLLNLTPTSDTNYSLWKATSKLKRPKMQITPIKTQTGLWARSDQDKANAFASHLHKVFEPLPSANKEHDEEIKNLLTSAFQMHLPLASISPKELVKEIRILQDCKAPGYDQIDATLLKHLPRKGIIFLVLIFNACLRLLMFPSQWKIAQVIMVLKPGKPGQEMTSYRPISLLPITGKIFEKVILTRMKNDLEVILPNHQFGFREGHGTIEQVHRLVDTIHKSLENKQYCSAIFLDISQAFDKVWHDGLLSKIKQKLAHPFYQLMKSYLEKRCFEVKYNEKLSMLHEIKAGVPQGSILGPILYLIFTADLPTLDDITTTATYADDTSILSVHANPETASKNLQRHLSLVEIWFDKWRIKANKDKSVHVTYTLRRETCPPVLLYNERVPQANDAKYLGMHLDRRLTWQKHVWTKRKQLDTKIRNLYWLIGPKSQLTHNSKILVYKSIIKPIWTYGIQLWGSASNSNIAILERFQSKTIRKMLNIPQYVSNQFMYMDIKLKTVSEEIEPYSKSYQTRLKKHRNELASQLLGPGSFTFSRLKRHSVQELAERFTR